MMSKNIQSSPSQFDIHFSILLFMKRNEQRDLFQKKIY